MREALESLVAEMLDKGITLNEARTELERRFLQRALTLTGGNRSRAARKLGMHRNTLGRMMSELHLHADGTTAAARRAAPKPAPPSKPLRPRAR